MPSTLTHYLFNKTLIKDEEHADIFLLGGQGADVFFFYGYNLLKRENKAEIRNFGSMLHSINPDNIYMEMLRYANNKEEEEYDILINFIRGFMYHYCLDRNLHPYIFYNTGFPYTNKEYNFNHGNFESILDTLLMKKYNCKISTRKAIKTNKKKVKICSKMFHHIAKEFLNIDYLDEFTYYKAYKDFRFVRLIIDSKYGIKKWIFNKLISKSKINSISQPKKVKDDNIYDYLNKNKRLWVKPDTGITYNYSVEDLFKNSELDTRIVDTIIHNYKNNLVTQRKISKFTDNINHDGRNLNNYMTYFKIIWEETKKND